MQTISNVFKWSLFVAGYATLIISAVIFSAWFFIEMLVVLVDISA